MSAMYRRQAPATILGQHRRPRATCVSLAPAHPADMDEAPRASCASSIDDALWFPGAGQSGAEAKMVCAACPMLDACAAWAIPLRDLSGVWGGLNAAERAAKRLQLGGGDA